AEQKAEKKNTPPPVEEVSNDYVIKQGDTLDAIALEHDTSYVNLMIMNDLETEHVQAGQKIIVNWSEAEFNEKVSEFEAELIRQQELAEQKAEEDRIQAEAYAAQLQAKQQAEQQAEQERIKAEQQEAEQQEVEQQEVEQQAADQVKATPVVETTSQASTPETKVTEEAPSSTPTYNANNGSNVFPAGECVWYAFDKRTQLGKGVGQWGNASNWASAARSEGYSVNNTPSVGAIMQTNANSNGAGGYGHVAIVDSVNSDGSIVVSEMNWGGNGGSVSTRTLSPMQAASHSFIH